MSMEIYYFSGTGNSLAVARDLAAATGAKLVPIPSVMDRESLSFEAEAIGIVFPSYYETFGEYCLACFHWCPKEAIVSSALKSDVKYHHPEVKLKDMLLRA